MKEISGSDAIERMRQLKHTTGQAFTLHHLTYNSIKDTTNGMRVVRNCRLRPGLPGETFKTDADLYLPYTDVDRKKPGMCFKILMRYCAFPPDYELLKINWFQQ